MDLVAFAKDNWTVITQAPWAFAVCAVLFGGAGFVLGRFWLSERVANLESRIAHRDETIASLKSGDASKGAEIEAITLRRHGLLGQLSYRALEAHADEATDRMRLGLDLVPPEWINSQLNELGERWRVRMGSDGQYQIYEAAVWG